MISMWMAFCRCTFYISAHMAADLLLPVKMGDTEAPDSETEDSATREAIGLEETQQNVQVEDLHYSPLKYVEEVRQDLLRK
jgi:hypothetical protein